MTICVAHVDGVECRQCAIAALQALKKIKQIDHVDCVCPKGQYDQAVFECYIERNKKKSLPLKEIQTVLKMENFRLQSIKGIIVGTFDSETLLFTPLMFDKSLSVKGAYERLELLREKNNKENLTLSGALDFDDGIFYID